MRLDAESVPAFPILIHTCGGGVVVCSWAGGAGGCRGRPHLPTRDALSRRHNNRLARQRSPPGAARGARGARGGEGAARVGAWAETSCPASGLGPAFDPRSPAAPLQASPREPLSRPQLTPFSPTQRAERSTPAPAAWRCPGGAGWPTKGLNTSAW